MRRENVFSLQPNQMIILSPEAHKEEYFSISPNHCSYIGYIWTAQKTECLG